MGAHRVRHRRRREPVVAHFTPQSYGASFEDAIYTVDGIYTYADGGESRYARLYFRDGVLRQVFGFTGEGGTGAPREIIPQAGDTFTVLENWMDLDQQGQVAGSRRAGRRHPDLWRPDVHLGGAGRRPRATMSSALSSKTWTATNTRSITR